MSKSNARQLVAAAIQALRALEVQYLELEKEVETLRGKKAAAQAVKVDTDIKQPPKLDNQGKPVEKAA